MAKPFTKTQLIIALIVFIFLSSIPSIIYIINFRLHNASSDPANWGTFGDFIGGTTNVILGIINIVITAYIAYLIKTLDDKRFEEQSALETQRFEEQKKLDEKRHLQNIDIQKNLFIKEIKFQRNEKYNLLFLEFLEIVTNESDLVNLGEKIPIYNLKFLSFLESNKILFPFINDSILQEQNYYFKKLMNFLTDKLDNMVKGTTIDINLLQNDEAMTLIKFLEITNNKIVESLQD